MSGDSLGLINMGVNLALKGLGKEAIELWEQVSLVDYYGSIYAQHNINIEHGGFNGLSKYKNEYIYVYFLKMDYSPKLPYLTDFPKLVFNKDTPVCADYLDHYYVLINENKEGKRLQKQGNISPLIERKRNRGKGVENCYFTAR